MFDSVGRDLDEEALARTAKSSLLTLLLGGSISAGFFAAGLFAVKEYVAPVIQEEIMELAQEEAEMEAPPPPPPPPPPPAAAAQEEEQDEEEEPTPDEMTDEVKELKDEVKQEMKSDVKPAGVEGGVVGGVVGGQLGGVQGGVVGGVVGGQLGAPAGGTPPKVVHHSEIEWKKRYDPVYPAQAKGLGLGEQACKVVIKIDEEGVPYDISIEGCPKVFHEETRNALMKWRAYPLKVGGQKIKIQSTILVKYREL
jgi:outer membrane biosynthesis protein TonB